MNTFIMLALIAFATIVLVYLFTVLSDYRGFGEGKCDEEDYNIADKIAAKLNK